MMTLGSVVCFVVCFLGFLHFALAFVGADHRCLALWVARTLHAVAQPVALALRPFLHGCSIFVVCHVGTVAFNATLMFAVAVALVVPLLHSLHTQCPWVKALNVRRSSCFLLTLLTVPWMLLLSLVTIVTTLWTTTNQMLVCSGRTSFSRKMLRRGSVTSSQMMPSCQMRSLSMRKLPSIQPPQPGPLYGTSCLHVLLLG